MKLFKNKMNIIKLLILGLQKFLEQQFVKMKKILKILVNNNIKTF